MNSLKLSQINTYNKRFKNATAISITRFLSLNKTCRSGFCMISLQKYCKSLPTSKPFPLLLSHFYSPQSHSLTLINCLHVLFRGSWSNGIRWFNLRFLLSRAHVRPETKEFISQCWQSQCVAHELFLEMALVFKKVLWFHVVCVYDVIRAEAIVLAGPLAVSMYLTLRRCVINIG